MSGRPRLAVAFPLPVDPVHMGKDVGLVPEGLRRRGWDVELHCTGAHGEDWPLPVHTAPRARLGDPSYWAGRGLDAAIAFTFVANGDIPTALRAAGVRVVAKGDTTGVMSPRVYTRETLAQALFHEGPATTRLAAVAGWLARLGPRHGAEVRAMLEAVTASDAFVVETEPARRRLLRVIGRYGDPALAERLHIILNPVAPAFTRGDVPEEREKVVLAIGRWDIPAKNAALLARALRRFLAEHPDHRAHVIGAGSERRFGRLGGRVVTSPHVDQAALLPLLSGARIVVSSSRWESFAIASHEGLASGCSVVGPRLGPFEQAVALGPFGTVQHGRGAAGLAAALGAEARAWEHGERHPSEIAAFWRPLVDVDAVAERFERLLAVSPPAASADAPAPRRTARPTDR